MAEPERSDRPERIILVGIIVLAIVTIGATIFATTTEWAAPPLESETTTAPQ